MIHGTPNLNFLEDDLDANALLFTNNNLENFGLTIACGKKTNLLIVI